MFDNDTKEIRKQMKMLQRKVKKYPLLFARLGECHIQLGDWKKAEEILTKGVEERFDYLTGHAVLAGGYLHNGYYKDARKPLCKA